MNEMIRRRMMMGGSTKPYDAEVEYLRSTGAQYIDTLYVPRVGDVFACDCSLKFDNSSSMWVTGWYIPRNYMTQFGTYENKFFFGYNYSTNSASYAFTNNIIRIRFNKDGGIYVDDTLISNKVCNDTPLVSGAVNNKNLLLFRRTGGAANFYGNIYYFKIYVNQELIRDFIPVRIGNVGYMYDRVSGQLFGNQGTGQFIIGPDKTA